jgi:hypothetical protein
MPSVDLSTSLPMPGLPDARAGFPAVHDSVSLIPDARPCACGARLPLQVRLHLRSRTRPVFEGRWCCSTACLQARITIAVRREMRTESPRRPHQHRVPLGLMLLSTGRITQQELQHALQVQCTTGERIGEVLIRECGVSELTVAEALATQWSCPVWDVSGLMPDRVAALAPRAVLKRGGILPLRLSMHAGSGVASFASEARLSVAFANSIDPQAVFALRKMHDIAVDAGIAPITPWSEAHSRLLETGGVPCHEMECSSASSLERAVVHQLRRLQPVESRWVRLHEVYWLRMWLEPAAMLGGPAQKQDVVDFVFHVPIGGALA